VRKITAVKTKVTITGSGPEIPGAVIMIEDGVITGVGPASKIKIPWNAEVVDATDRVVMPGYVLAHTSEGLERGNESMPDVPFLSTFDAIDPFSRFFRIALRNGITTILVMPGNATRFGGTGSVVRPVGKTVEEMLVMKPYGLKISLLPGSGETRMGHMQKIREYLQRAKKYFADRSRRMKEAKEAKKAFTEEVPDEYKVIGDLFGGKITAFIYCPRASDVIRAIELTRSFKFKAVLVLGKDTWKAAPQIGKAGLAAVLPPDIVFYEEDPATGELKQRTLPLIFKKARVSFAFQIDPRSYDARYPWQVMAEAVKYGLPRKDAIAAMTSVPARLIGLGSTMGRIQKGCRADLLLLTGDPLDPRTWIDKMMIDGKIVYERSKDEYLKKLLGEKKTLGEKKK